MNVKIGFSRIRSCGSCDSQNNGYFLHKDSNMQYHQASALPLELLCSSGCTAVIMSIYRVRE